VSYIFVRYVVASAALRHPRAEQRPPARPAVAPLARRPPRGPLDQRRRADARPAESPPPFGGGASTKRAEAGRRRGTPALGSSAPLRGRRARVARKRSRLDGARCVRAHSHASRAPRRTRFASIAMWPSCRPPREGRLGRRGSRRHPGHQRARAWQLAARPSARSVHTRGARRV